ncbi:MAG: UDP-N-acetylmuramoyl-L-alanine--D-glutamate ligase [Desulfobacula sp.]|nr:UDP-N-acetylmuramoyl-L-alanine--D-glutamate ligase [Desulfobacula sp.]
MINISQPYYLVAGLGASGLSMAGFLKSKGKKVIATDIDASRTKAAEELNALGIETQIGFHDQKTFNSAAFIVPSPGIPLTNKYIKTALENGVKLSCELDIFSTYNTLPIIAITGTNGKTTTTTLIGDILRQCGRQPFVGGNIGTPLIEQLMIKKTNNINDIIVAEISSFQLDIATRFKPDIALLLNISEDHLDRYDSFQDYEDSKWSIFKNQTSEDTAVINAGIDNFDIKSEQLNSNIVSFSSRQDVRHTLSASILQDSIQVKTNTIHQVIETGGFKELCGVHNHENMAAAILACLGAGCNINDISKGLVTFKNLPHRTEWVRDINDISFYNDSKATNTDAVIRALDCFERPIILILGGREKGTDFSLLVAVVQKNVKAIMAIGESKGQIKNTFETLCPVFETRTMKEAVNTAFIQATNRDVVLLSPACASFDMYDNYAHRGDDFKTHVNELEKI